MSFQQNLQYLMDINGLSNYQLAKELDCHQSSVANWLDGARPQKKMLKAIADRFGLTVEDITGEKKPDVNQKEKAPAKAEADEDPLSQVSFALFGEHDVLDEELLDDVRAYARFKLEQQRKAEEGKK